MNRRTVGREVFVDASAIIALVDSDDALHQVARQTAISLEEAEAHLVLSDAVLSEFLAYCSSPPKLRKSALATVDVFMGSSSATVLPASRKAFVSSLDLYRSRPDKQWSLVDCSSILICQERGIRRVFTHDRHFRQAGFDILLP